VQSDDDHIVDWFVLVGGSSLFLLVPSSSSVPPSFSLPKPNKSLLFCRYTGALLLSQPANTSALEHRDNLVNKLMVATGLTAAMSLPPYLRRDLPLFFETFEAYKVKAGAASSTGPPAAAAETVRAATASSDGTSLAAAAALNEDAPHPFMGPEVIKVSGLPINITSYCSRAFPRAFPRALFPN
jgi:hypothetical protein